jgi:hypothetical protein
MAAKVEIIYRVNLGCTNAEEKIPCNYAKIKEGCLQIAHEPKEGESEYVSTYIPLDLLQHITIHTDKSDRRNHD